MRTVVVLPAPFGPSRPSTLPCGTTKLTSSTAVLSSKRLTRLIASTAGSDVMRSSLRSWSDRTLVIFRWVRVLDPPTSMELEVNDVHRRRTRQRFRLAPSVRVRVYVSIVTGVGDEIVVRTGRLTSRHTGAPTPAVYSRRSTRRRTKPHMSGRCALGGRTGSTTSTKCAPAAHVRSRRVGAGGTYIRRSTVVTLPRMVASVPSIGA